MATIEKRGDTYKITVSKGYDINGKQIRDRMTWTPNPGMTQKQIEKELTRQAVLFEETSKHSAAKSGNIRLLEFTDVFMTDYANLLLKPKTAFNYRERMKEINQALGHIKLKDLKPGHIASFYANLQEKGMRRNELATIKLPFEEWLKDHQITMTALSEKAGVSAGVLRKLKAGEKVKKRCALAIYEAMNLDAAGIKETFTFHADQAPLKAGTIQTYHRVLSAVLFRAVKWGYITANPAANADLPSTAHRRAAYLDEPDIRRLLDHLKSEPIKWRSIIIFDLLSGLRLGELAGLRWSDINFDAHTLTINQTSNYIPKRGLYIDTPKTASSSRPVKISEAALYILLEHKRWQEEQEALLGDVWHNDDDRVFTTDDGAPIFPSSVTQWFTKFMKRTGLPKVTIHSLRHTYASIMIAEGIPLVVVSHQLGHAQTSTTNNIYAHVIASAEARAAQTFDKFNDAIMSSDGPTARIKRIK